MTDNAHFDNTPKTDFDSPKAEPILGSIFAMSGVPKAGVTDKDFSDTVEAIANLSGKIFDRYDVVHLPNTPVTLEDAALDDPLYTPEARIAALMFTGAMVHNETQEEIAEQNRIAALTPEQRAAEDASMRAWTANIYAEAHKRSQEDRTAGVQTFYDTAQKWATLPDLNATERCHGVAHDLYLVHGVKSGSDANGRTEHYQPGDDYAKHYEHNFADDIRTRAVRSAKELFGG